MRLLHQKGVISGGTTLRPKDAREETGLGGQLGQRRAGGTSLIDAYSVTCSYGRQTGGHESPHHFNKHKNVSTKTPHGRYRQ